MPPEQKNDDEPEIRVVTDNGPPSKDDVPAAGEHFQRDDRTPRQKQEEERKPVREAKPVRERSSDNRFADDEDEPLGPRVQKRINHFRRRTGDAETRAEALAAENRRLIAQVAEAGAAAMSHYESAAIARLDAAKREHLDAYESGDGLKVVEASRKLASAQNAIDNVEAVKARQKAAPQPEVAQPAQRATYSEQTQDWIDDHPWFESDQRAKEDAIRIHDRMVKQGYTPDTPKYFKELTARCRTMFPEYFDDAAGGDGDDEDDEKPLPQTRAERRAHEDARRAPPVAAVSRTTTTGRRVTEVKLTDAMIEAAQIAGVPPKKYAEQYLALRKEGKL